MWTDKGNIEDVFAKYHHILTKYGCSDMDILALQNMWNEPHRFYHNQEHLEEILGLIEGERFNLTDVDHLEESEANTLWYDTLIVTAFFHDAIYDPHSKTNEEESAELFKQMCVKAQPEFIKVVENCILDTKDHTITATSIYSDQFLKFDLNGMINGSLTRMISDEAKIMREFGFVDYDTYKNVRGISFLEKFAPHVKSINPNSQVDSYIDWFKNRVPNIAIYPGSFFPFHKGHLDILKRAERVFDKVIILLCVNPTKNNNVDHMRTYLSVLRKKLPNNQIEFYDGMLHNYIKLLKAPINAPVNVTIVKGLRSASDFDAEKLQLRFMEDMSPDINVMYIVSDRKFEHVSSSAIKQIQSMGSINEANEYLI